MGTILDALAAHARERAEAAKAVCPPEKMREAAFERARAERQDARFLFERRLARPGMNFICECKKASPSKGLIAPDFPYLQIAKEYEEAGAAAISVLTEPKWFLGSDRYLREIAETV
ncbi:MAG: indole-3-glycerol-phosphate synthase TrpC, partial [Lachnospiraceae bacterium]|nr:indole-3-glycerol-phosphate synthase TrpC [Lachnospiraceae bacterium]